MKLLTTTAFKVFYVLVVVSFFIASFFLGAKVSAEETNVKLYNIGEANSLPVLAQSANFPTFSAEGIIAVDASSNVTLFEKNADEPLYPASTTKIITALVGLDYYKMDDVLTVQAADPTVDGQKMGLMAGEQMTFQNMLNGLLIYSANDAAVTISDNYPGGRDAFVNAMNAKANALHLTNSHFANPVGLDDPSQVTTARDMVRVSQIAMTNPIFSQIVGTKEKIVTDMSGKFSYDVKNVNELLGTVPGVIGIKTGWTEGARENLISEVQRNGHGVYIALLGSEDRFGETTELINWIYGNYSWQNVGYVQKAIGMVLK
ncbi:MAG TPA: D-alanyl-D-alanine carboxypeptidase family protein [Patescibacteria group bacterium]|nr:D-alanyl-D-alanine carboxypeptidase family protein [Patescibacteria group bacterium]